IRTLLIGLPTPDDGLPGGRDPRAPVGHGQRFLRCPFGRRARGFRLPDGNAHVLDPGSRRPRAIASLSGAIGSVHAVSPVSVTLQIRGTDKSRCN
ncbi:hypothetical protein BHE74_00036202, partial [Ensete ventricosum]